MTLKKYCILLIFALNSFFAIAQTGHLIRGSVVDSAMNIKLATTSISLLNAKDSTLVKFSWADSNGAYQLDKLINGKYILLLSYPEYADYVQLFSLDSSKSNFDFGTINLTPKARLLNEVIVKGKMTAVKMKGDTIEFNAGAFVIQPNAKVEDLLKQLPGIQVDNNGKIKAYGQLVNKVLVDGEEFFGDDPTLVTRNLRGDMIDKVQVFDKKSDQAAFTGIDDGVKNKTINLKLKEDKKTGYFGKLDAGLADKDFYRAQGMINLFKEKQKMAVYGNTGNTGTTGLSSGDNRKYGTDGGVIEFVSGGITLTGSNADEIESGSGRYNGQGIPLSNTSGAHYDGKWNKDKESINTNYKIGSLQVDGQRHTVTQNDLPNGLILNNLQQDFTNYNFRQRLDAAYQINFSKTSTLKIKVDGVAKKSDSENEYLGTTFGNNFNLLNRSNRTIANNSKQEAFNANVFYSKKLKKDGRTFSWNLTQAISSENSTGNLNSINQFYDLNGVVDSIQKIDQFKIDHKTLNAYNSNFTYSEPVSKSLALSLNYQLGLINSSSNLKSLNVNQNGSYTILDRDFSSDIELDQFSNQLGAIFNYNKGINTVRFGTKITAVDLKQVDHYTDFSNHRDFLNWNPQINYRMQFSQQKLLILGYFGNTLQPTTTQIQPIKINTDPLNVMIGNTDLRPAFRHSFSLNFNNYKIVSGTSINIILSYDLTENSIINAVNTDLNGKSTYQAVNLKDKNSDNFVFRGDFSKQIKSIDGMLSFSFVYNKTNSFGFSNNQLNIRKNDLLTTNFSFNKNKSKKYDFFVSFGPNLFKGSSTLQQKLSNNGYGYDGYLSLNLYLPHQFEFKSATTYNYQSKTDIFNQDYQVMLINASVAKKLLKDESLKLSLTANDLLNQNKGFNRNSFGTMVTQNSYTTIARYFMLSLTWDFSKFGKSLKTQN